MLASGGSPTFGDCAAAGATPDRQVTHALSGGLDLPVTYSIVPLGARGGLLALGRDLLPQLDVVLEDAVHQHSGIAIQARNGILCNSVFQALFGEPGSARIGDVFEGATRVGVFPLFVFSCWKTFCHKEAERVTAQFTLNLLVRANRELEATFDLAAFAHEAFYNPAEGRIEIYFRSLRRQSVMVAGHSFAFAEGERVHTEYSYKYDIAGLASLAGDGGFELSEVWTDPGNLFAVAFLEANPNG